MLHFKGYIYKPTYPSVEKLYFQYQLRIKYSQKSIQLEIIELTLIMHVIIQYFLASKSRIYFLNFKADN